MNYVRTYKIGLVVKLGWRVREVMGLTTSINNLTTWRYNVSSLSLERGMRKLVSSTPPTNN